MQFIANGPDISDALLQAHEEGRVVFFCGAGISYPAGLPGFKGLVDKIYDHLGTTRSLIEEEAYTRSQFDATLELLERRVPGQHDALRDALKESLKPKLRRRGATDTHAALLQLARSHEGSLRLVTTNFDRIFDYVAKRTRQAIDVYSAPMLPIPKNSRWNGLVYLHGSLPGKTDNSALTRLVLTSGDFGLAYLTERWAARFVSELFRNYVVCFVGYSINDPVLRYMMDALAADRRLGEETPLAYALADCEPGQESVKTIEWEAKGVVPILYEVPSNSQDHSLLHDTLRVWAETYRDGILGKERIVVEHALAHPSDSTQQDDFVGRMLWALSHESGSPAKRFADFNPVPALAWIQAFAKNRYAHADLSRFGISANDEVDKKLHFSLINRPAPYTRAPWMSLVSGTPSGSQWDDVMFHLARWMVRHMNDPELIIWLAQQGGHLNESWSWLIGREMDRLETLVSAGNTGELNEILANSPNAIPSPLMKTLWRLLLIGRVKSPWRERDLYQWKGRLKSNGLTATLRLQLVDLLAPKITLKQPFRWDDEESVDNSSSVKQLVEWELVLAADHVYSSLPDLNDQCWNEALPALIDDFQRLLLDALDMLRELGDADDRNDRSHWDLPSISPHKQNRRFRDWVALIELVRDAWGNVHKIDPGRATRIAQNWFDLPYPTFKRLALFAASHDNCITSDQWVEWLSTEDAWWLWSVGTRREALRLLVLQGGRISAQAKAKLESVILVGPPREMYRDDIELEDWVSLVNHSVWLRLAKLQEGCGKLGPDASLRFGDLSAANPGWKLASNESDEFSHWMTGTGDPDYEERRHIDIAPRKRRDLVAWLKQPPPTQQNPFHEDNWRDICRTRFFHSICALSDLAKEGLWPPHRWQVALQVWGENDKAPRSWQFAASIVQIMPQEVVQELSHTFSWWLKSVSRSIDRDEDIFLDLCQRVLVLEHDDGLETDQPVTEAINHPVGQVTEALLNIWFKQEPNDNDLLPENIKLFFTQLCDTEIKQFRHGRVLLASRLIALFRVDRRWVESHLLAFFDWSVDSSEAKALWEGFLWSPRLYRPLLIALKKQFLETAQHFSELGDHSRQYAAFLTYVALDQVDGFTVEDFQKAVRALPQEGLQEAAQALYQALEGAGEQREDHWKHRIQPFWQHIWPKSRDLISSNMAESLARLSIAARGEFPDALSAVISWLQPIDHPGYIVHLLSESHLIERFPEEALCLLDSIIEAQSWAPSQLGQCLETIVKAMPTLENNRRYLRLVDYLYRHAL